MRWQGVLGTALGDENASAISWCPLVRIEAQREPAHYGVDARMTGTLEAGMSMGARFSRGGQSEAIWRFDFGWRHTPRQPSDGEATNNEVVVGTGISLVVYRHLAMDAFLRGSLSVPGSGQGLFGLGLTVGRQR